MQTTHIGEVIRELRQARRLARLDVQRLSGVSEATIARAERGGTVTKRTAERLAPVLGCAAEDLLGHGEPRP